MWTGLESKYQYALLTGYQRQTIFRPNYYSIHFSFESCREKMVNMSVMPRVLATATNDTKRGI